MADEPNLTGYGSSSNNNNATSRTARYRSVPLVAAASLPASFLRDPEHQSSLPLSLATAGAGHDSGRRGPCGRDAELFDLNCMPDGARNESLRPCERPPSLGSHADFSRGRNKVPANATNVEFPAAAIRVREEVEPDAKSCDAAANFECNICFELATDPVVTICGHLFCWLCLYQWLHVHSGHHECPVCKGEVADDAIIPIYGRGSSAAPVGENPGEEVTGPPRPSGHRVEGQRQQSYSAPVAPDPDAEFFDEMEQQVIDFGSNQFQPAYPVTDMGHADSLMILGNVVRFDPAPSAWAWRTDVVHHHSSQAFELTESQSVLQLVPSNDHHDVPTFPLGTLQYAQQFDPGHARALTDTDEMSVSSTNAMIRGDASWSCPDLSAANSAASSEHGGGNSSVLTAGEEGIRAVIRRRLN